MNVLVKIYKRAYWIAAFCIVTGFTLMVIGNTALSTPYSFTSITLAPCLLLVGYAFIAIGIMKKSV